MKDTRSNKADDLKELIKANWASVTPENHRLIASMPSCIDTDPTKSYVHIVYQ